MTKSEITVNHPIGLHARPAARFVETAKSYPCDIRVTNLSVAGPQANAKSILSVLALGVTQGNRILLEADGPEADEALLALTQLVESDFD
jgi:phosphotransferase system HPr (HPr) family protein